MKHTRSRRLFHRDERGAVTIEFVLAIPLFLAAMAFAFEFGRIFLAYQQTVNNVRAATRYLSRADASSGAGRDFASAMAARLVRTGVLTTDTNTTGPDYLEDATVNVTVPDPAVSDQVGITVAVQFPLLMFFLTDTNGDAPATMPFSVQERARHVGM